MAATTSADGFAADSPSLTKPSTISEQATGPDQLPAPAFLDSDKVDEQDQKSLYGPRMPVKAIIGTLVVLAMLVAAIVAGLYWFNQRDEIAETETATTQTPAPVETPTEVDATAEPTPAPATAPPVEEAAIEPEPEPEDASEEPPAITPGFWADVTPILNPGSAEIIASTYTVSAANRAVLTGHTAAITGIAVSDDGRVLTSGADRRLVDWGADVTVSNPDVLNVPSPLTVLERTEDQRIIAGDADGNITVIDLVDEVEPVIESIHGAAISAAAELSNGSLAVASADGPVAVFFLSTPGERLILEHSVEVTAIAALADNTIATASVDGVVRLWNLDGTAIGDYATLTAPATALIALTNGDLAVSTVDGRIQILAAPAEGISEPTVDRLRGHVGAVRSLFEVALEDGTVALASGGDDTTIRLWDLATQTQLRVLEGHGDIISGIDALPDGRIVSTSGDGTGRVWDLTVPEAQLVTPPHDWNVSALHPWDNDQIVTGGIDGQVVLASTADTSQPQLITQHEAPIVGLSVLPDGAVVSLDSASVLRMNDPAVGATSFAEVSLAAGSTALDVLDAERVVSGHADGTVRLHDFDTELVSIQAHNAGVSDVTTLSSGLVVSSGQDGIVQILDVETGQIVGTFSLHTGPVDVVAELADGRVASAGADGIFIYTVEGLADGHVRLNGQRSRTLTLMDLPGERLFSTGDDGRVRLWDLSSPDEEPVTVLDIPGVVNPHLIQADNGLFVAGAARGYVVFTIS